jgi:hypothetical protein
MSIKIKARYSPTFNRNNLPIPLEDPRLNPSPRLTWDILQQTKKSMLQAYQITVSRVLSRLEGTDLVSLRNILIYEYYFTSSVADDCINFITMNETKDIEFEQATEHVNRGVLYRKPRIKLSLPVAEHSIWLPHKH